MSIRLTIWLYGTLAFKVPNYDNQKGIIVDKPDNVTPEDLLKDLEIPLTHVGLISDGTRSIPLDAPLENNMGVNFYSMISGG